MARSRLVVLLAGPLLLAGAAVAAAQAPPPTLTPAPPAITPGPGITTPAPGVPTATVTTPAGDVTVLADHLEQVGADNLLVATGNVEITRATTRITADRAEINRNTGDLVAVGRVVLYDVDDRITGERIDYNLNSGTGVVYNGAADVPPYYHIGGERMERRGEGRYHIRKGFLTTCEDDPPTWGFHFGSLDADLETSLFGTNGSLWVKKLPVLPFVPFFAAALRRERQTGFLFPLFGSTTRKGYFYEQPFYWAISDSQDATFTLDYYQLRGIGANVEYRYLLDAQNKGTLNGFFIKENLLPAPETDHGENRGWFGFRHESLLGPGLTFKADINAVSDDVLLRDYGDQLYQRSSQDVQSNVFVTKSWSQWSMTAAVFEYQDLTSPRAVELYRLPDVRFSGSAHPVEAWNGFTYTLDSRLTNFVRDVGSSGGRLDIAQRISQPFSPGGYFTVTPFLATQMTAYSTGVTGTRPVYREGLTIEETDGTPRLRPIYSVGGDVTARASRVYQTDGFWNLDAVLHSIEPQVNYTMLDGTHFDKLPQWTDGDAIQRSNAVTYSLINRLRARTVAPVGTEPVRWDLARLTLSQSYNLMETRAVQHLSNVSADLLVEPKPDVLRFRATTAYNPYTRVYDQTNVDVGYTLPPRVTASLGYSWQPSSTDFLSWGFDAEINRYLVAHATANWDLITDTFVENRLGLDVRFQCWAISFEFIRRQNSEDEMRFSLNLLGLASPLGTTAGVGAFTGRVAPGAGSQQ